MTERADPIFQPVRSRRLFEEVCAQISQQISSGVLKTGDKLPAERDLAVQFGISRSAVREALRSLEFAGLIRLQKGVKGGSFILGEEMGMVNSFQNLFELRRLSLEELIEARIEVQDAVIRIAAQRLKEADIKALERDVKRTQRHLEQGTAGHDPSSTQEFYTILAEATDNRVLAMIVKALSQMVYHAILPLNRPLNFNLVQVRLELIGKLRERDAEGACRIMREYLLFLHNHIVEANKKAATAA